MQSKRHATKKKQKKIPTSLFLSFYSVAGFPESKITVTKKTVKEVMTLDDECFDKFYRHTDVLANITSKVEIDDDFDAIFGTQMPK